MVPLETVTATDVTLAFRNHWLLEFGASVRVISDRGNQFTSSIFALLSKMFAFDISMTTAYHPKMNGRLERFHFFLKQRLRILAVSRGLDFFGIDDWDVFLPSIQFGYIALKTK